jgi:hypothetical protein
VTVVVLGVGDPRYDPVWQAAVVGEDSTHTWMIKPMLYNHRLIGVPHDVLLDETWGWCYPDKITCTAAAALFDPAVHDEPDGWRKRATHAVRRAPGRDVAPDYNQPRCVHGTYLHRSRCDNEPKCDEINRRVREGR